MRLQVVTPQGEVVASDVEEVYIPGALGEFGVLPGHVPFLSAVKPGVLRYRGGGAGAGRLAVGSGLAEVGAGDQVIVLVEQARAERGDEEALRAELNELRRRAILGSGIETTEAAEGSAGADSAAGASGSESGKPSVTSDMQRLHDEMAWIEAQLEL